MMKIPNMDAAIMPPNTGVPTAWRVTAPAPSAMTRGNSPKMKAKLVIITGRNRKLAASMAARIDVLPEVAPLHRKRNDQDAVLRRERDQHDEPDLRVDIEAQSRHISATIAPSTATLTDKRAGTGIFQLS